MIFRVFIAVVGALIVTGGLLLVMEGLTTLFENERGERFFRISDVLERPERGRPERPRAATPQPELRDLENQAAERVVPLEAPAGIAPAAPSVPAPALEPQAPAVEPPESAVD